MKKQIFIFGLILLSIQAMAQKKNVVDYFRLLPDSLKHYYSLEYKNGKWFTESVAEYQITPVVDIRNGFIEIQDDGTGGGTTTLQVVLYRKKDGSALIGVSYNLFDGVFFENSIFFGEYKNNKWIDLTHKVLPKINLYTFMKSGYKIPDEIRGYLSVRYSLPQHGTTITVDFQYGGIFMYCSSDENKKICDEFTKNVKYDSIKLKWDKENTRFVIQK